MLSISSAIIAILAPNESLSSKEIRVRMLMLIEIGDAVCWRKGHQATNGIGRGDFVTFMLEFLQENLGDKPSLEGVLAILQGRVAPKYPDKK